MDILQKTVHIGKRVLHAIANYMKNTYIAFWLVMLLASAYSCVLVYSATHTSGGGLPRTVIVQILACLVGYFAAIIISLMDYERLGELWWLVAGGCIFLVGLTYFVGVGASGEYSLADDTAWLNIFGVSFQPSELMKIGFIITFSYHLSVTIRNKHLNSLPHLLLLVAHVGLPAGMIFIQGDDGSALMFMTMAVFMIIGSGISWKYLLAGGTAVLAMLPIVWMNMNTFQKDRIRAVYNPMPGDELGSLYQQYLGRLAVGSGGLTGQGWCNGRMIQSGLVPADHNDRIFTVAAEEFGFIGASLVLLILVVIMFMSLKTALNARDDMGRFVCLGFFGLIATQTVFNVGMCLYFGVGLVLSVYMRRNESNMQFALMR